MNKHSGEHIKGRKRSRERNGREMTEERRGEGSESEGLVTAEEHPQKSAGVADARVEENRLSGVGLSTTTIQQPERVTHNKTENKIPIPEIESEESGPEETGMEILLKLREGQKKRRIAEEERKIREHEKEKDALHKIKPKNLEITMKLPRQLQEAMEDMRLLVQNGPDRNHTTEEALLELVYRQGLAQQVDMDQGVKGDKQEFNTTINGVDITVLLDEGTHTVNPRVSLKGDIKTGKKTQDLKKIAEGMSAIDEEQYLKGIKGEAGDPNSLAFKLGMEARMTMLLSDILVNPGGPAYTNKLLQMVRTTKDVIHLFTGPEGEKSYGAIPSQNQSVTGESDHERKAVFNTVMNLMNTGEVKVSAADSNIPVLRKLSSMLQYDKENKLEVNGIDKATGASLPVIRPQSKELYEYIDERAHIRRQMVLQKEEGRAGGVILSEEEDTDTEARRFARLPSEEQKRKKMRAQKAHNKGEKVLKAASRVAGQDVENTGDVMPVEDIKGKLEQLTTLTTAQLQRLSQDDRIILTRILNTLK
jgi:hypothetical protein